VRGRDLVIARITRGYCQLSLCKEGRARVSGSPTPVHPSADLSLRRALSTRRPGHLPRRRGLRQERAPPRSRAFFPIAALSGYVFASALAARFDLSIRAESNGRFFASWRSSASAFHLFRSYARSAFVKVLGQVEG
jgi:hypothetical protein